jgi:hypothetical protein
MKKKEEEFNISMFCVSFSTGNKVFHVVQANDPCRKICHMVQAQSMPELGLHTQPIVL